MSEPLTGANRTSIPLRCLPARAGGQLLDDQRAEAVLGHRTGDPQRVLDGPVSRRTVTDDARATDAEQGATAELLVLEARLEVLQGPGDDLDRLGRQLRQQPGHLLLEAREEELDGALAGLQEDVAHEPLADDDPRVP